MLNVLKNIYFVWRKTYYCRRIWTCFAWDNDILWLKSVWLQCSKVSKIAKMIFNSISDSCLVVFASNMAIQSLNLIKPLQNWQTTPHLPVWLYGLDLTLISGKHACLHSHPNMVSEMTGKFKITFFQYGFMNFFFSSKKREKHLFVRGAS